MKIVKVTKKSIHFVLIPILSLWLIALLFLYEQLSPVVETRRSEVRRMPSDVHIAMPITNSIRVPILMYHYVEFVRDRGDTIRQSLDILPPIFEEQLQTLQKDGYTFMTASDLADVMDGNQSLPKKPILLTFDDGHWDLATDVLPILEKYHVKATAYIISGFIGGADFMTKEQLEEVIRSGLVEIGAHTVHHISLASKLYQVADYEIAQSKADLEKTYGLRVVSFAYPNGSFDNQAITLVHQAGFKTAVSTIPGIEQGQSNRYFLYRLRPGGRTGTELLNYLEQTTFRPW